jgi:hypothetical protein
MTKHKCEIPQEFETYEIRIEGHLKDRWEGWLEGLRVKREAGGTTMLHGELPDQTALHTVLLKIRNMNLKILSVQQIDEKPTE